MWKTITKNMLRPKANEVVGVAKSHNLLLNYPIKESSDTDNIPPIWTLFKKSYLLQVTRDRVNAHLKPYNIEENLHEDITPVIYQLFSSLSSKGDISSLKNIMLKSLATAFTKEHEMISGSKCRLDIKVLDKADYYAEAEPISTLQSNSNNHTSDLTTTTSQNNLPSTKLSKLKYNTSLFSSKVSSIHFTYGPYPLPPGYVPQNWFSSFITINTPADDAQFESYPKHKAITKKAMDAGVFIKLDTIITFRYGLLVTLVDENEYPVARFTRESIRISFISPHFTPWDELFELDETGNWNLAWDWRIADVDDYLKNKK